MPQKLIGNNAGLLLISIFIDSLFDYNLKL